MHCETNLEVVDVDCTLDGQDYACMCSIIVLPRSYAVRGDIIAAKYHSCTGMFYVQKYYYDPTFFLSM